MTDAPPTILARVVVVHPSDPALLATDDGAWPTVEVPRESSWEVEAARRFGERYGADVLALRRVHRVRHDNDHTAEITVACEAATDVPPAGLRWVDRIDALAPSPQRDAAAAVLAELAGAPPPELRAPWGNRGWFAEATSWAQDRCAALGLVPTGRPQQVRTWSISCVLSVPTDAGRVFFKATSDYFRSEARITETLASWFPGRVPDVLATDHDRGWMLMRGVDGAEESDAPGAEPRGPTGALAALATMQREMCERTDELRAAGAAERGLDGLAEASATVLADDEAMHGLSDEERIAFERAVPAYLSDAEMLAAGPVGESLVHGDFHPGNVIATPRGPVLIDWSDAALSHPFIDLGLQLERDDRASIEEYLGPWSGVAGHAELRATADLAVRVERLYQVVTYHRLCATFERPEHDDLGNGVAWTVRRLLKTAAP